MAKNKTFSLSKTIFLSILMCFLGFLIAFVGFGYYYLPKSDDFSGTYFVAQSTTKGNLISLADDLKTENFAIHFIEPGTYNAGDIVYIKAGTNDILIDSGAPSPLTRQKIITYLSQSDCMGEDKTIEYLIVTHAHNDHYGDLTSSDSLFSYYEFKTIIDFSCTNQKLQTASGNPTTYAKYLSNVQNEVAEGAVHYTAKECIEQTNGAKTTYNLAQNIQMEILYNKFYFENSPDENNHSVCTMFTNGGSKYLFTGDLEEDGEKALVDHYATDADIFENVILYKAGHHGSKTSSSEYLLSKVKPKISVAMCCAGSTEYTTDKANTFPTQKYIDNISKYTDMVYVPSICTTPGEKDFESLCGDIVIISNNKGISVAGTKETIKLKDSNLFVDFDKYGKTLPENWKAA